MSSLALQTWGLTRKFGKRLAVDRITLEVPQGAIYAFLGPNGSGKTTTIRMILGLLRPDAGTIFVSGNNVLLDRRQAASKVGALLEAGSFYPNISARKNLLLTARLLDCGPAEVSRVLAIVELEEHADRKVREFSLGMRQRLGIARALLGSPSLLILDEPTNGLDPDGIVEMRQFLRRLPDETGATVLLSSHLLAEVEQIATHLGVLNAGRLVAQGYLPDIRRDVPLEVAIKTDAPLRAGEIIARHGLSPVPEARDLWQMPATPLDHRRRLLADLNRSLVAEGIGVFTLAEQPASLESFYRQQTTPLGQEQRHAVTD
jgi:ABC-2 type transport system ATP-binding protein